MLIRVRKSLMFGGAVLLLIFAAVSSSMAGPCSPHSEAPGIYVPDRGCFEIGVGYQYEHFHVLGVTFHNNAYNANFGMHLFDWLTGAEGRLAVGVEGAASAGFGGKVAGTPPLDAKSVFVGAGPHISIQSRSRFEPWVHGLVGLERLRFTQTATLGANPALGFILGGGVDFRLSPRIYWRFEGDYVGTHYQSDVQSNYAAGTGLVLYF